jgi:uncharacterized protein YcfJ
LHSNNCNLFSKILLYQDEISNFTRRPIMIRNITAASLLALATALPLALPVQHANAQDALGGAIIGGVIGAGIGGAATGRAGGAIAGGVIGAVLGASIADQMQPRQRGYYYYQDDCWRRRGDGSYQRTYRRYCG